MDKLRCIAVDDEPLALKMIENFIEKTPFLSLEGSYTDPLEAFSVIKEKLPEVLFLDIQMPEVDGLELSKMIPSRCKVIFTTAFREYALESYDVGAIDYLLKPIRYQKFLSAAQKAKEWFDLRESSPQAAPETKDFLYIKSDSALHKVALSDIVYIQGMKDYLTVHLEGGRPSLVTHLTMKAAQEILPPQKFMRVHKSYIVALDKIESVSLSMDISVGGILIHVGDIYREDFEKYLSGNSLGKDK